jgi:outer membrane murein-binding lipoprotein Lpp
MNTNTDYIKQNERIIYLVLIVALVIALITISTCNIGNRNKYYFVESQVATLNDDIKDLENKVDESDSTIKSKTKLINEKKQQIQELIRKGAITVEEAQREIKNLRSEVNNVKEQLVLEKRIVVSNSDSLDAIISNLQKEKGALIGQVEQLRTELNKKPTVQEIAVKTEQMDTHIHSIQILSETKLLPQKGLQLSCKLYQPAKENEAFSVYIYDDQNTIISPQDGIYRFVINRGEDKFSGSSSNYKKGVFKVGKQYYITIRNSENAEIARFPFTPHIINYTQH